MKEEISLESWVTRDQELPAGELDGEVVILGLEGDAYYTLDDVGGRVWELLAEPRNVAAIRDILVSEYETTAEECGKDLLVLLDELQDAKLVKGWDAPPA